jgi:hypothetical protein
MFQIHVKEMRPWLMVQNLKTGLFHVYFCFCFFSFFFLIINEECSFCVFVFNCICILFIL